MILRNENNYPVMGIQNMLRFISLYNKDIPGIIPDGIFGEDTKNSILAFQRTYGIEQTGEVDYKTWKRIYEIHNEYKKMYPKPKNIQAFRYNSVIKYGDYAEELYVIQAMILALSGILNNIPEVDVNGKLDDKSAEAIIVIQGISGLEPTGIADVITYNAIADIYKSHLINKLEYKSKS